MEATFVIPLFNGLAYTRVCLRTLQATLPAGLNHEIILVDDASTDGTRDWLPTLPAPCRFLLQDRNLGFAAACNRGAAAAHGDLLFLLNSDLELLPGWFEPMRAILEERPDAGVVGNVQLAAGSGAIDHVGLYFDHHGKPAHATVVPRSERRQAHRRVPAVTGACCALRTAGWRELGGFDEGFVNGGEDVDLCLRARAAGRQNYVALRSVVRHHVSRSPGRKHHDEANSRRLMVRWAREVAPLAAPAWSRHYLAREWAGAYSSAEWAGAARAVLYGAGLLATPGAFAVRGAEIAIEHELARWRALFDGIPAPTPEAVAVI